MQNICGIYENICHITNDLLHPFQHQDQRIDRLKSHPKVIQVSISDTRINTSFLRVVNYIDMLN